MKQGKKRLIRVQIQETQPITKEIQKLVLKTVSESPTLLQEELTVLLKSRGKKITQEEVSQVIYSISPNKNWHRATQEEVQKEILEYIWTLELQVLFLLPTKQKETTIAEFNQVRLQNKQPKVSRDLIRHLQTTLMVDGKNLAKFRKFQRDLTLQSDLDPNIQGSWLIRIILANLNLNLVTSVSELSNLILNEIKEKYQVISEKIGKTFHRLAERFVEKYIPKGVTESRLKELIGAYQAIYHLYKKGTEGELGYPGEAQDQNKLIQNVNEKLREIKQIVDESQEGGFLRKMLMVKIKNKEEITKKISEITSDLNQIQELSYKSNKALNEKLLLVQKLQSDYENIVLVKSQLENDLYNLNEKISELKEKNASMEKELQDRSESLERAHEKIATQGQKVDQIPEIESKANMLREELAIAKDISLRLYRRVTRLKEDLLKQFSEKPKNQKINNEQKSNTTNNTTIHKIQQNQEVTTQPSS